MKKLLTCSIVTLAIVGVMGSSAQANVKPANACRFQNRQPATWTEDEVRWTVRCLATWMNVDVSQALYIANRESNFYRFAWNHSSDCRGIYQHMYKYWWGRVATHDDKLDKFAVHDREWSSPRAQAVVTFAMVKRGGWGPWST